MARPKITLKDLPKGWKEKTLELARVGASDVEIRAEALGCICHETWTRLKEEEPEFSETLKKAKLLCNVWWEQKGRTNLENRDFLTSLWFINMKNRFKWKDKHEEEVDKTTVNIISPEPLTPEQWEEQHGK